MVGYSRNVLAKGAPLYVEVYTISRAGMARFCRLVDQRVKKVLVSINTTWNLVNFRSGLIRALNDAGYEVIAASPPDEYITNLKALRCRYVTLPMDNKGTHPGRDLFLLWRYLSLLKTERPSVYLGYTVKPNVYGSLACRFLGIPVINNIAGLGIAFGRRNWLTHLVRLLYRLALSRSKTVFFQNDDDRQVFIRDGLVREEIADRIPGSVIDLVHFQLTSLPNAESRFRFLLLSRMLWDKGVGEYVEAARVIKRRYPKVECCLLGFLDVQNPNAISRTQMDEWIAEGCIRYLHSSDDVRVQIADADCVVLPSFYREGVPRSLLEAAAMGRPIITTDSVGCREAVEDGVTGLLCQPRDIKDLVEKMEYMLSLTPEHRKEMGERGRQKMQLEFDEKIVIKKYLEAISKIPQ